MKSNEGYTKNTTIRGLFWNELGSDMKVFKICGF